MGMDEAAESVALVLASAATIVINLANRDVDRGVLVGLDDTVSGAAPAGE